MKQIELTADEIYNLTDDVSDREIQLVVEEVTEFTLYNETTLNDVFESLDLTIEDIAVDDVEIDIEEIFEEICFEQELDYEDFAEIELQNDSVNFLEAFLKRLNSSYLSSYSENRVIDGEEIMYMMVRFYSDEYEEGEINTGLDKIKNLKLIAIDENSKEQLESIDLEDTHDEKFYIIRLITHFN